MSLTLNAIIQTAERDIEVLRANKQVAHDRALYRHAGASSRAAGKSQRTGFLSKHVRYATKPSEVIRNAIRGRLDGVRAEHPFTRLLYGDEVVLIRAAQLAEQWGH